MGFGKDSGRFGIGLQKPWIAAFQTARCSAIPNIGWRTEISLQLADYKILSLTLTVSESARLHQADIPAQGKTMVKAAATLQGELIASQAAVSSWQQVHSDKNVRGCEAVPNVLDCSQNRQQRRLVMLEENEFVRYY